MHGNKFNSKVIITFIALLQTNTVMMCTQFKKTKHSPDSCHKMTAITAARYVNDRHHSNVCPTFSNTKVVKVVTKVSQGTF